MSTSRRLAQWFSQLILALSLVSVFVTRPGTFSRRLEVDTRWKGTYTVNAVHEQHTHTRLSLRHSWSPDTTAVILNWSRLPNVIALVRVMCTELRDTIAEILIWNNNPKPLVHHDFLSANCPARVLRIYNSPENIYFQARFLACAQASTPYCFIQDDDYFIRPSIIRGLRSRIAEIPDRSVHLLPAFEMLYSQSSTVSIEPYTHTLFAWLGYGTIMHQSRAAEFLKLLQTITATEEVLKMADNYFTILANRVPELWFDQNHELGGGQAFTVGAEGEERNNRHIVNAGRILDSIVQRYNRENGTRYPYISLPAADTKPLESRAICYDDTCLFETNINSYLPLDPSTPSATEIIAHIKKQFDILGSKAIEHYLRFPPSNAVDGRPETNFQSVRGAAPGDWIGLNMMDCQFNPSNLEFVLLVDSGTEIILQNSIFESSVDIPWEPFLSPRLKCYPVEGNLKECSIPLENRVFGKLRVRAVKGVPHEWVVHEVWVRRTSR